MSASQSASQSAPISEAPRRLVILDFDGTMTDAEAEGGPFRTGYLEDLAILSGLEVKEVQGLAARFEADILTHQGMYGWMYGGHIVAPASVDPYLRIMPVARRILDHVGAIPAEQDRSRLLDGILYKYNYQKTVVAFRPGAASFLKALGQTSGLEAYVVTNSHTEPVARKLEILGAEPDGTNALSWLVARVHGRARKYVVEEAFDQVPRGLNLPGLERPVLLRRPHYAQVLSQLTEHHGIRLEDVTVVGDIFELDLALPLALGARVVLLANAHTPAYEKAFVSSHPRGYLAESLGQVALHLGVV